MIMVAISTHPSMLCVGAIIRIVVQNAAISIILSLLLSGAGHPQPPATPAITASRYRARALRGCYQNELPVSGNAMRIVREILVQPPGMIVLHNLGGEQ
jgi:hypothetical protein